MAATIEFNATEKMATDTCCSCGIMFAMPEHFQRKRREDQKTFYCPNGHSLSYTESTVKKLERQLAQERQRLDQAMMDVEMQRSRAVTAEKGKAIVSGKLKKVKDRVKNGVCPECNRYFANLHRHMECKHGSGSQDK